ncbi:hypothetical protein C7974DRAFT_235180 [Boeremia exigua]|uniref:uncharacterized protein n=1 Tax=Boeremia exigua TaxID=749465 RepID=UPI001E8CCC19|nr:uncharacterized protein C7974DRAFT_235180 [Boeremia exigua]KAH6620487.1 hypothetical protein C7974DRAFT_235180 [Boeremia exigua]
MYADVLVTRASWAMRICSLKAAKGSLTAVLGVVVVFEGDIVGCFDDLVVVVFKEDIVKWLDDVVVVVVILGGDSVRWFDDVIGFGDLIWIQYGQQYCGSCLELFMLYMGCEAVFIHASLWLLMVIPSMNQTPRDPYSHFRPVVPPSTQPI